MTRGFAPLIKEEKNFLDNYYKYIKQTNKPHYSFSSWSILNIFGSNVPA